MRVVVVGAGAMGALYGTFFHDAGEEVWFVEKNPATVDAINVRGALIRRRDERIDTYRIPARQTAAEVPGPADLILFQVKGFATAAAAAAVHPLVGPDTMLLTLQNGLGNEEALRAAYPDTPILIGMSVHTMAQPEPGTYYHSGTRETYLGPSAPGLDGSVERVARSLDRSGYAVVRVNEPDIRREVYGKWVLNCGSLPVLSVTGLPTDRINGLETVLQLCDAVTAEACELARTLACKLRVYTGRCPFGLSGERELSMMVFSLLMENATRVQAAGTYALRDEPHWARAFAAPWNICAPRSKLRMVLGG